MPRYKVTMRETCVYQIEVDAENDDDAQDVAENVFVESETINDYFMAVEERDTIAVRKV
jgi:hypothetical protein